MFDFYRAGEFSSFSHSVSTADCASGIFIAWSSVIELVHKVVMTQRTELLLSNVSIMIFFVVSLQCAFLRIRGLLRYMCTHAASQNYLLVDELDDVVPRDQLLRFCEAEASPSTKFCVNSCNHSGDLATGFTRAKLSSSCGSPCTGSIFCFGFSKAESCAGVLKGVLAEMEQEASLERPGTTMGT